MTDALPSEVIVPLDACMGPSGVGYFVPLYGVQPPRKRVYTTSESPFAVALLRVSMQWRQAHDCFKDSFTLASFVCALLRRDRWFSGNKSDELPTANHVAIRRKDGQPLSSGDLRDISACQEVWLHGV